jgi:hypothetical protein
MNQQELRFEALTRAKDGTSDANIAAIMVIDKRQN